MAAVISVEDQGAAPQRVSFPSFSLLCISFQQYQAVSQSHGTREHKAVFTYVPRWCLTLHRVPMTPCSGSQVHGLLRIGDPWSS